MARLVKTAAGSPEAGGGQSGASTCVSGRLLMMEAFLGPRFLAADPRGADPGCYA